jgi:hypothetical protein
VRPPPLKCYIKERSARSTSSGTEYLSIATFYLRSVFCSLHEHLIFTCPRKACVTHSLLIMMLLSRLQLLLTCTIIEHAFAAPHPYPTSPPDTWNGDSTATSWSKEAKITLLGVCFALACFIVGLAWPRLRKFIHNAKAPKWSCSILERKTYRSCSNPPMADRQCRLQSCTV